MADDIQRLRPAYLAGHWYPDKADACLAAIASYAGQAAPQQSGRFRGIMAPHAGWSYSGPAAAQAYKHLAWLRDADVAVVFGSHRAIYGPNTVFRGIGWDTPLGVVESALDLADVLARELRLEDEPLLPRSPDNGIELHLPFVRHFFPEAKLLALGVAAGAAAAEIGAKTGALCRERGRRAVFVGSTDLTHYGPNYGFAPQGYGSDAISWVRTDNDKAFIDCVLKKDVDGLLAHANQMQSACCPGAVAATLTALEAYGHRGEPQLITHYLSCDVQPSSSFVGYASIVI